MMRKQHEESFYSGCSVMKTHSPALEAWEFMSRTIDPLADFKLLGLLIGNFNSSAVKLEKTKAIEGVF